MFFYQLSNTCFRHHGNEPNLLLSQFKKSNVLWSLDGDVVFLGIEDNATVNC